MQNLADHLSRALLAKLPMWSKVEIEPSANDFLVILASLPAKSEHVPELLKLVPTFRFVLSGSSSSVRWPNPFSLPPSEFEDQNEKIHAMKGDLEKWWEEVAGIFWAVRDDCA